MLDPAIKKTIVEKWPGVGGQLLEDCVAIWNKFSKGHGSKTIQRGLGVKFQIEPDILLSIGFS